MKITLNRKNKAVHFEAVNESGNTIQIDGPDSIGGEGKGMRPMEILLTAIAGCSSFDLVEILKKQKQSLSDVSITISGDRKETGFVKPFETIHLQFDLKGDIEEKKAARAIQMAVEKYCSVAASLHPDIKISHDYTIEHG